MIRRRRRHVREGSLFSTATITKFYLASSYTASGLVLAAALQDPAVLRSRVLSAECWVLCDVCCVLSAECWVLCIVIGHAGASHYRTTLNIITFLPHFFFSLDKQNFYFILFTTIRVYYYISFISFYLLFFQPYMLRNDIIPLSVTLLVIVEELL